MKKQCLRPGRIYVAKYYPGKPLPQVPHADCKNVLIHVKEALSPYQIKNEAGQILENIWQFAKLYPRVSAQSIPMSRWQPDNIIWSHPAEVHWDGKPTEAYWEWRDKGMNNKYAVRYPNGYKGRTSCKCSIWGPDNKQLSYIEARKQIYCGEYARLAPSLPEFQELLSLHRSGTDIQLVEVDGPDPTLTFAPYDRISPKNPSLEMDEDTIRMLVNDERKPFGHGFVIAALLLGGEEWIL